MNEKILNEIVKDNSSGFQSTMSDDCFIRFFPKCFYQIQEDIALECSTAIIELLTKDVSQETGWLDLI